ncbi:DUF4145 domain-containing protein [Cupriavidus gilardii]|uniref:DUF4145 domain-containing protein n=1 Tax=Cupriavidus gilardii TaxID=82541 RepID=A0ABY4VM42_9BURK|nr:DUF4145 domain-containing protein [Cupriavidus gilardii]USE78071.1 DUF4145 domain-containing protein [Cupriavidus gilardii]
MGSADTLSFSLAYGMMDSPRFGIDRCPHAECGVAMPNLTLEHVCTGKWPGTYTGILKCTTCKNVITVKVDEEYEPLEVLPALKAYSTDIPERARLSLTDARGTLGHPSPSIMCSAQAIDWMLKEKGYVKGDLNSRIKKAAEDHLITEDMEAWAHEVRLGANAERHADLGGSPPTIDDAQRLLKFAEALAEILFELPARVRRGRAKPEGNGAELRQVSRAPKPISPF